jgi:hypothetical protein
VGENGDHERFIFGMILALLQIMVICAPFVRFMSFFSKKWLLRISDTLRMLRKKTVGQVSGSTRDISFNDDQDLSSWSPVDARSRKLSVLSNLSASIHVQTPKERGDNVVGAEFANPEQIMVSLSPELYCLGDDPTIAC